MRGIRGITLISLIITIIIILILVGISISSIIGQGIFEKAKLAKEKYENSRLKEETELIDYENKLDKYINNVRDETNINDYRENLICEYNMNNISNNILYDNTENNINGNIIGNEVEVKKDTDGRKYIQLDGQTQIWSEEVAELAGDTEKTIMCLFRTEETTQYRGIVNIGKTAEGKTGFATHLYNGYIRFDTGNLTYLYDSRAIFAADNKWHFICTTYDKTSIALYFDDKPIFATNATLNTMIPRITIGCTDLQSSNIYFKGDISDVRVYNKGLNIEEVYRVYKNIKK